MLTFLYIQLQKMKTLTTSDHENANARPGCSTANDTSSAHAVSTAIEVPKNKNTEKYAGLMVKYKLFIFLNVLLELHINKTL